MAGHDFEHGPGQVGEVGGRLEVVGDLVPDSHVPDLGQRDEDVLLVEGTVGLADSDDVLRREEVKLKRGATNKKSVPHSPAPTKHLLTLV